MNKAAQRIAIAQACGWKKTPPYDGEAFCDGWILGSGKFTEEKDLPDYLNSLDAMHEAEKALFAEQVPVYFHELCKIAGRPHMSLRFQQYLPVVRAIASQRAEAYLRAIGKWVDTE